MIDRGGTAQQEPAGLGGDSLQQERMSLGKSGNVLQALLGWLYKITSSFFRFGFNELQISFWEVNLYLKNKKRKREKKRQKGFSNV